MTSRGHAAPEVTLAIVGNGPGEVAGFAVPIAAAVRRLAAARGRGIRVALCLPPCQFASGEEARVAHETGVFDRIVPVRQTLRAAVGLDGWKPERRAVLLHVGGDFWYTRRLARLWRAPAFAFVERAHVARVHHGFQRIFVPLRAVAERLARHGVPEAKVLVTGDPRHDTLPARAEDVGTAASSVGGDAPCVTVLTGSRNPVFSAFFPFWVQTVTDLRARLPLARLKMIISPFVAERVSRAAVEAHRAALKAAGVEITGGGWNQIAGADLVLTIPGTVTMELAVMRMPSLVVGPAQVAWVVPLEGMLGWVTRPPLLGPALRRLLLWVHRRRRTFVALPNMLAGQEIMPELTYDVTPAQVADESARLLHDPGARAALARALEVVPRTSGAGSIVADAMAPLWASEALGPR